MKKRVLLVEPSFYGVSFVKAARSLGCEVICIVSDVKNPKIYGYEGCYDDLLVADIRDPKSILNAIDSSKYCKFDALIPATDYVTAVTARVAKVLKTFGTSVFAATCARNKDKAREVYAQKEVPSAKFAVVRDYEEAIQASKSIPFPFILKPTNTASSINVFYIENKTQLKQRMDELKKYKTSYMNFSVRGEYLIEEFLNGPEFSVELFLNHDKIEFVEVTEKHVSKPPYFVELMHVFPTTIDLNHKQKIINVAFKAAQALDFHNGPMHIEVKLTSDGPKIIEVNGRPGGDCITSDLIPNAYGINIFKKTVELYLDHTVSIKKSKDYSALIRFIFADTTGIFDRVEGMKSVESLPEYVRHEIGVFRGDKVTPPRNSDDRIGYYILNGPSGLELKKLAGKINHQLQVIVK
ncbi:ATP-grasp domain-containing protein [Heyndrickxia acidiproducens]|uniref:ATP-grasp domain-containing protein n=1 Tax=Heyndrickxia acidiproducens TaxID=1121084 RepID=UPI000361BE8A|nr:ATP-grasp domain-containing protein [Heyndrickxia acidiproducens]